MTRLVPASALLLVLAVTLTGCFPGGPAPTTSGSSTPTVAPSESSTPTPEPETAPNREDLAISPEGIGTIVFGEHTPTDPVTAMLVLDPAYCLDSNAGLGTGFAAGSPEAARWVPIPAYRDGLYGDFGVEMQGDTVVRVDAYNNDIPTTEGVRIGDHRDEVTAAYPGATVVAEWATDIYVIMGEHGVLQIEVARQPTDGTGPYWQDSDVGYVTYIHAVITGYGTFTVAASENVAGGCPF
jgi:hypothetical protein